jgi:hypothetical protein
VEIALAKIEITWPVLVQYVGRLDRPCLGLDEGRKEARGQSSEAILKRKASLARSAQDPELDACRIFAEACVQVGQAISARRCFGDATKRHRPRQSPQRANENFSGGVNHFVLLFPLFSVSILS